MFSKNLSSVWNNLKKIPEFKKKIAANAQLNDGTALPFLATLFKDIYKAYIQSNRNSWDYQISCYNFNGLDKHEAKKYLIKQYNNCLSSIDEKNPWVIDERDKRFIKIIRKHTLENEEKLSAHITQTLENELAKKSLPRTKLKKRKQYLYEIATLACFKYRYDHKNKILIFKYLKSQKAIAKFEELLNKDPKIVQLKIEKLKALQKKIANNDLKTVTYSKYHQESQINTPTYWEQAEDFLNRKAFFKFINATWDAINSHTTLLRWASFTLIIFSLPFTLPTLPLIIIIIGYILGYLIFLFNPFAKLTKISTFANLLEAVEKDKVLDHIKQEIFNKKQYENQLSIFQDQLLHLDITVEKLYKNIALQRNKNSDPSYLATQNKDDTRLKNQLENSSIYQKLNQVSPKTQFTASLVTKIMRVTLSAYLISWAASILFNFIGALFLATLISSPLAVGLLILIPVCVFFITHLIKYQSRKNTYQKTICTLLQEPCEFSFMDNKGETQKITLKKWEKFEYLRKEIQFLEREIKKLSENNQSSQESQKIFSLFSNYLKNDDIYASNYQDQTQRPNISSFTKTKEKLDRLFSFSAGAFYGFSLGGQIAVESSLGFKSFLEIISLPIYICRALIFLPLIIMHGIANFLTHHFNSRQRNLLFFAEHLDSKLQILEYRRKILSYLTAILKELDPNTINTVGTEKAPNVFTEKRLTYLDLAVKKINSKQCQPTTKFFMPPIPSLTSLLGLSEANETDSRPNLTR